MWTINTMTAEKMCFFAWCVTASWLKPLKMSVLNSTCRCVYRLVAPPDGNTPVQQGNHTAVVFPQIPKQVNNRLSWIYSVVANVNEKWFAQWATTLCHCKTNSKDHMIDWCHFVATHQLWSVNLQLFLPGNRPSSFISYKPVRKSIMGFFFVCFPFTVAAPAKCEWHRLDVNKGRTKQQWSAFINYEWQKECVMVEMSEPQLERRKK